MRDAYYYNQVPDGPEVSILILLIIIAFIAAIIWLVNYTPGGTNGELEKEIKKIFSNLKKDADTFDRPECKPALMEAETKVLNAIRDAA